tara:strand:+ start:991 stop:1554 length:564 start_codon:yes stop_codon:yes gene_type:complete
MTNIDRIIKRSLYDILSEQEDTPEPDNKKKKDSPPRGSQRSVNAGVISTTGAFGSGGRAKGFVTAAGARAKDDPDGLMKDLGITAAVSGEDLTATLELLRIAIHGNSTMSEAYLGAKQSVDNVTIGKKVRKNGVKVVSITMNKLDRKNGVRFLAHTLQAAQNSGKLSLQGGLQFAIGSSSDIVLFSI